MKYFLILPASAKLIKLPQPVIKQLTLLTSVELALSQSNKAANVNLPNILSNKAGSHRKCLAVRLENKVALLLKIEKILSRNPFYCD